MYFCVSSGKPVQLLHVSPSRGTVAEVLQLSFYSHEPKSSPILFVHIPCLCWLKKYEMQPGKQYPVKLLLSPVNNAIISACNEIDQQRLLRLICSHCWQSGDGLPVRIHCVECFISKQWFNALWSTTSCASHTSSGVLLENTLGEEWWGLVPRDKVSLHCRNCADWVILIDRPCLYSEVSEVQECCATAAVFAKGGKAMAKQTCCFSSLEKSES